MRAARSIGACLLLAFVSLGVVGATPSRADADYYRWYGRYNRPYYNTGYYNNYYNRYYNSGYLNNRYTNTRYYNPYRGYSPYWNAYYKRYPHLGWYY